MNTITKIAASAGVSLALIAAGAAKANADSIQVKPGDTLSHIALDHGTDVDTLIELNHIQNRDVIHVGDTIELGQALSTDASTSQAATTASNAVTTRPVEQAVVPAQPGQTVEQTQPVQSNQAPQAMPVESTPVQATQSTQSISPALQKLIDRESGGNVNATNGIYYGIGQLSPAARVQYGGDTADYQDQLQAMQAYIADRYGSAEAAWAHSQATGWY